MSDGVSARLGKDTISRLARVVLALFLLAWAVRTLPPAYAGAETRSLKIYHIHTGEHAVITYKKDGRYLPGGLKKLDYILRDWRRDEPARMDPHLFDLLWEVYQQSRAHDYIYVVGGYRAPETNALLRTRSRGVAKASQHILGKAIDFFIPGVPLKTLREVGLRLGAGGVGYYPTSGSPFVHMDVGKPRYWPRMSRQQLLALFPNGRTVYVPSDGKPLPGYQQALAVYEARQARSGSTQVASASTAKKRSFYSKLFGIDGGADVADDEAGTASNALKAVATASRSTDPPADAIDLPTVPSVTPSPRPDVEIAQKTETGASPLVVAKQRTASTLAAAGSSLAAPRPAGDLGPAGRAVDAAAPRLSFAVPVPVPRPRGDAVAGVQVAATRPDVVAALIRAALAGKVRDGGRTDRRLQRVAGGKAVSDTLRIPVPAVGDRSVSAAARNVRLWTGPVRLASLAPAPSQRSILIAAVASSDRLAAISTGVRTAAKEARVAPDDAGFSADADVVAIADRPVLGRLLSARMVLETARVRPRRFGDAMLIAPTVVYAAGFQRSMPGNELNAFNGAAVTFFALAKFASLD